MGGQLIDVPVEGYLTGGWHRLTWESKNRPAGTYFLHLKTDTGIGTTRKIQIVR